MCTVFNNGRLSGLSSSREFACIKSSTVPEGGWTAQSFNTLNGVEMLRSLVKARKAAVGRGIRSLTKGLTKFFDRRLEKVIVIVDNMRRRQGAKADDGYIELDEQQQSAIWANAISNVFDDAGMSVILETAPSFQSVAAEMHSKTSFLLGATWSDRGGQQIQRRTQELARQVTRIDRTTRKRLSASVNEGISKGMTVREVIDKVRKDAPSIGRNRIPTIVRTEMGKAADEGVKQALIDSEVVTYVSVIGCEAIEKNSPTYKGIHTCNIQNVPIHDVDQLTFHPNHTGAIIPSDFVNDDGTVTPRTTVRGEGPEEGQEGVHHDNERPEEPIVSTGPAVRPVEIVAAAPPAKDIPVITEADIASYHKRRTFNGEVVEGLPFESTVFYHGAKEPFNEFDLSKLRTGADKEGTSWYGDGMYLTGKGWKAQAYSFVDAEKGVVMTAEVKVKKPFIVRSTGAGATGDALRAMGGLSEDEVIELTQSKNSKKLTQFLQSKGYDSVAVLTDKTNEINELVVFSDRDARPIGYLERTSAEIKKLPDNKLVEPAINPIEAIRPKPSTAPVVNPYTAVGSVIPEGIRSATYGMPKRVIDALNEKIAKRFGLDPRSDDVKAIRAKMTEITDMVKAESTTVNIRISESSLSKVLETGRFKTQFETNAGTEFSEDDIRGPMESNLFSLPEKVNAKERPIYGYLEKQGSKVFEETRDLNAYGKVAVRLKPSVRERTTWTYGDSLVNGHKDKDGVPSATGSPMNDPNESSIPHLRSNTVAGLATGNKAPSFRDVEYVEAQIFGGVAVDDINEVVFPPNALPSAAIRKQLTDLGIRFTVEEIE